MLTIRTTHAFGGKFPRYIYALYISWKINYREPTVPLYEPSLIFLLKGWGHRGNLGFPICIHYLYHPSLQNQLYIYHYLSTLLVSVIHHLTHYLLNRQLLLRHLKYNSLV